MSDAMTMERRGAHVQAFFQRLAAGNTRPILYHDGEGHSAPSLLGAASEWEHRLEATGIRSGAVCAFVGDYGPGTVSLMLALMRLGAIAMPLMESARPQMRELLAIAGARMIVNFGPAMDSASAEIAMLPDARQNGLVTKFEASGHPGLIVFTSGSSGQPKGILHDYDRVLVKFAVARRGWRTVLFLMMDHFGGINTLISCLAHGGLGICVPQRSPEAICQVIEAAEAELLPTTPTFLNMLLVSGAWRHRRLSSLRLITYGAEPMPVATLHRIAAAFPEVELKQTYGLSELGVLRSQSADRDSLWLRVGGEGFETRVKDGVLHIRSISRMVGYLNAPNAIDDDGWMNTGDLVDERGGMLRFLGREAQVINVGGQKVFPAEVEDVLLEAANVAEATVYGRKHPLLGQAVCARVSLLTGEDPEEASQRLRALCLERLAKFKVPLKIDIVELDGQATDRSKKNRTIMQ
jgi:long-chain acyl-CoA synthetase